MTVKNNQTFNHELKYSYLSCRLSPNIFKSIMLIMRFSAKIISRHSWRRLVLSTSVINQLCRVSYCETSPSFGLLMKSTARHPANTLIKGKQPHSLLHHIISQPLHRDSFSQWHALSPLLCLFKKIISRNRLNMVCFALQEGGGERLCSRRSKKTFGFMFTDQFFKNSFDSYTR